MSDPVARFKTFRLLAILTGLVAVISPLIGLMGTVLGMRRTFETMGAKGVKDANELSQGIGEVLVSTASGLVIAFIGLAAAILFLVLALVERRKLRQPPASLLRADDVPPQATAQKRSSTVP